jgi:hypothetical protein
LLFTRISFAVRSAFEEAVWLGGYFQLYTVDLEE